MPIPKIGDFIKWEQYIHAVKGTLLKRGFKVKYDLQNPCKPRKLFTEYVTIIIQIILAQKHEPSLYNGKVFRNQYFRF